MSETTTAPDASIEANYRGRDTRTVRVAVSSDEIHVEHDYDMPGIDTVTLPLSEKSINQYTLVDKKGTRRHGSASSKSHHDRVHVLVRDGDEWTYINPEARAPARPRHESNSSDYHPTQLDGLEIKTEFKRQGGRGSENAYHKRLKITRELVDSHDDVYLLQYREEKGGSRDGEYHRFKNEQATKLTTDD